MTNWEDKKKECDGEDKTKQMYGVTICDPSAAVLLLSAPSASYFASLAPSAGSKDSPAPVSPVVFML